MADNITNNQHTTEEVHHSDSGHADPGGALVVPDPGMVIWTWLIFFLVLFLLRHFAWKPILKSLEEREESIKNSIDDAEKANRSLEKAMQEQRTLIDEGRRKAADTINDARNDATAAANGLRENAKKDSEKMIVEARAEIMREQKNALAELKSEVGNLSVMVASKLLDADLDNDRNRGLAKEYMTELSG
jgi:F-type H+-transporting ATPase subunit b